MTDFVDTFTGATIYPSDISYVAVDLSESIVLSWPEESSTDGVFATRIMDVTASLDGLTITLPDASKSGTGYTTLINNRGSKSFRVLDNDGNQIIVLAPGEVWQLYLAVNTTSAGSWVAIQYGSTVSVSDASSLAGVGVIAIGSTLGVAVPVLTFSSSYSTSSLDRSKLLNWTGAVGTLTLPDPSSVKSNWFIYVRNSGSGSLTVDPSGSSLIDGGMTVNLQPGESAIVVCDGVSYYTVGLGQPADFAFDYTVIDVAGTGSYSLSGTELNRVAYRFTGTLTGARNIIVPGTVQQYWVDNRTSGSFTLTVKTLAGTGVSINSGQRGILYCDGSDVINADTAGISVPLPINQGGTGAVTSSAALINLGGTSTGVSIFTAADVSAVLTALGATTLGIELLQAVSQLSAYQSLGSVDAGVF